MKETTDVKTLCTDFLIDCYFGQSKNLITGAIDRAYVDMAAHTLSGFIDWKHKWKCRYYASVRITEMLKEFPCGEKCFEDWYIETIKAIKNAYPKSEFVKDVETRGLTEGQARKWLNLTIKYLYVFKVLLGIDDERLVDVKTFLIKQMKGITIRLLILIY